MSKDTAKALAESFKSRAVASRWPHVDKQRLIAGLVARVDNPNLIQQAGTPFCGPASLTRTIANDDPDAYVRAAMDLYIKGSARVREMSFEPTDAVMQSVIRGNTDPADWLMLASIRDSDNWFFSPAGWFGLNVAGITLPSELCKWFRNAGYTEIVTSTYLAVMTKPLPTVIALEIQRASQLLASNYRVALFVHADMLDADTQDDVALFPNHWVVLTSPIVDGGPISYDAPVSFQVFTWGQVMPVPASRTKPLSKRSFMDHYFGFVAARF